MDKVVNILQGIHVNGKGQGREDDGPPFVSRVIKFTGGTSNYNAERILLPMKRIKAWSP